jgi:mannose-6-phosphate isomerase-like protein (cupin superfamily)
MHEVVTDRADATVAIKTARDGLTVTWSRYEPGESGPGPHVHREHADCFYVLGGEVTFGIGPEVDQLIGPAGTFVAVPANAVHTFRNAGGETAHFLNLHAPDCGFADMLRDHDRPWDSYDPPPDGGRPVEDVFARLPGGPPLVDAGREQEPGRLAVSEREVDGELRAERPTALWVFSSGDYVELAAGDSFAVSGRVLVMETPG